jgi:hypothetical protein
MGASTLPILYQTCRNSWLITASGWQVGLFRSFDPHRVGFIPQRD